MKKLITLLFAFVLLVNNYIVVKAEPEGPEDIAFVYEKNVGLKVVTESDDFLNNVKQVFVAISDGQKSYEDTFDKGDNSFVIEDGYLLISQDKLNLSSLRTGNIFSILITSIDLNAFDYNDLNTNNPIVVEIEPKSITFEYEENVGFKIFIPDSEFLSNVVNVYMSVSSQPGKMGSSESFNKSDEKIDIREGYLLISQDVLNNSNLSSGKLYIINITTDDGDAYDCYFSDNDNVFIKTINKPLSINLSVYEEKDVGIVVDSDDKEYLKSVTNITYKQLNGTDNISSFSYKEDYEAIVIGQITEELQNENDLIFTLNANGYVDAILNYHKVIDSEKVDINLLELSCYNKLGGDGSNLDFVNINVNGEFYYGDAITAELKYYDLDGKEVGTLNGGNKYLRRITLRIDTYLYTCSNSTVIKINDVNATVVDGDDINIGSSTLDRYKYIAVQTEYICRGDAIKINRIDVNGIKTPQVGESSSVDFSDLEILINGVKAENTGIEMGAYWTNDRYEVGNSSQSPFTFNKDEEYFFCFNYSITYDETLYRYPDNANNLNVYFDGFKAQDGPGGMTPKLRGACSYLSYLAVPPVETFEIEDVPDSKTIYANGLPITIKDDGTFEIPTDDIPDILTAYEVNDSSSIDKHEQYPTHMKAYFVKNNDGEYSLVHKEAFDDILTYKGASIRVTGKKGIRIITAIPTEKKNKLINEGIDGYKVVEYGTAMCWASDLGENEEPTLVKQTNGTFEAKCGAKGRAYSLESGLNTVYKEANGETQYTNTLVGNYTNQQCASDFAMRSYMIVRPNDAIDASKDTVIYGGTLFRSISYVAYQNRNAFNPGTAAYEYIWDLIKAGYGDIYNNEYQAQ